MSAPAETGEVAQVLLQRTGRPAPEDFAGTADLLVAQDAGASAENDARADVSVLSEAYLAAENRAVLNDAGSGDACLRGDDDVPPYDAVVSDVDEVVDLRPLAD